MNDAAERLRGWMPVNTTARADLDEALAAAERKGAHDTEAAWVEECARIRKAAERRATVERAERHYPMDGVGGSVDCECGERLADPDAWWPHVRRILDAVAEPKDWRDSLREADKALIDAEGYQP